MLNRVVYECETLGDAFVEILPLRRESDEEKREKDEEQWSMALAAERL